MLKPSYTVFWTDVLLKEYLPAYNKRFRVSAANDTDVHVKLPKHFIRRTGHLYFAKNRTFSFCLDIVDKKP